MPLNASCFKQHPKATMLNHFTLKLVRGYSAVFRAMIKHVEYVTLQGKTIMSLLWESSLDTSVINLGTHSWGDQVQLSVSRFNRFEFSALQQFHFLDNGSKRTQRQVQKQVANLQRVEVEEI